MRMHDVVVLLQREPDLIRDRAAQRGPSFFSSSTPQTADLLLTSGAHLPSSLPTYFVHPSEVRDRAGLSLRAQRNGHSVRRLALTSVLRLLIDILSARRNLQLPATLPLSSDPSISGQIREVLASCRSPAHINLRRCFEYPCEVALATAITPIRCWIRASRK